MARKTQRKGFSILSFVLGILLGMVILIGAVVGVGWYALSTDVDSALKMAGLENKDEEGNSIYINTDLETGGAKNLLDLVSKLNNMLFDMENLSVGEVEGLVPALSELVDGLHETVNQFIPVDRAEFAQINFSNLSEFVQTKVMEIQPAVLFDNLGMEGFVDNKIMSLVFLGREADYVVDGENKYPVYYDLFDKVDDAYKRVGDESVLDGKYVENLVASGEQFKLYYYSVGETSYITDEKFTFVNVGTRAALGSVYEAYNPEYGVLTGNYYRNGEERVIVNPITVGDFADGQFDMLNDVYLSDLLAENNELAEKILGGISMGDVMNNGVDFNAILNDLPLADLIKTKVSDGVMVNLVWKIKNIEENAGDGYTHTGKYTVGESEYTCYIDTQTNDEGTLMISSAYYLDGGEKVEITSITVGDLMNGFGVDEILNDLTIAEFIDIKADEAIMAYLGYAVYEVTPDGEGYTAKYDLENETVTAYITVDENNVITSCYYLGGDGERINIKSAGLNDISGRISGVTHKLTIGELIGGSEDPLIQKLGKYTIDNVSEGINELTIADVIKNADDNKMLSQLKDTKIKDLPGKINTLKMGDIMDIDDSNIILASIKDATIETLPTVIANITINDIYASEIYKKTVKEGETETVIPAARKHAVATVTNEDTQIEFNPAYIYYTKSVSEDGTESFTLVDVDKEKLGKLTAQQFAAGVLNGTQYYTYGEAQGVWSMLLEKDGSEVAYTLNNMTDMMANVSDNMGSAKLRDLHEAGILIFDNAEKLDQKIKYPNGYKIVDGTPQLTYATSDEVVGNMSLMDFINFILNNLVQD